MAFDRIARISEEVKRELSNIIRNDLKDPRLSEILSVASVNVSKDLRHAKVYISVLGDENAKKSSLIALKNASGFIRREIGSRINLRYTPEFTFEIDNSIEYGMHISEILTNINKQDEE